MFEFEEMKLSCDKNWLIAAMTFIFAGTLIASCGQQGEDKADPKMTVAQDSQSLKDKSAASTPTVTIVPIELKQLNEKLSLPGELEAYQNVPVHAKVEGFIKWIGVDRGSVVKKGDKLIVIFCPELEEKLKEAEAKVSSAKATYERSVAALDAEISKQVEAKAKLDSDKLTYERLKEAAKTVGAIAQNEVDQAEKTSEGDIAEVESIKSSVSAAKAVVASEHENIMASQNVLASLVAMRAYLTIKAPFDGVITERNVHEGSIVAVDASRNAAPLVRIQQKNILRLVVAVPEACVSGVKDGETVPFTVPAFLGKKFSGTIARIGHALDTQTRTMPVELNVFNTNGELEPGMFATVEWTATRPYKTLFLPVSAVGNDLKGTFVIRVKDNVSERVLVKRGQTMGNQVEIEGALQAGDDVALNATDELKTGTRLIAKLATADQLNAASAPKSKAGGE
jgi:membrane fusion protein, multidrug efflux system